MDAVFEIPNARLCEALGITVNELLTGERVVNTYTEVISNPAKSILIFIDVISVIGLIAFLVGPELFVDTPVADFMMKHRGLMVCHCILCGFLTGLFQKLHAEVSVEIKRLQNWITEIEQKVENKTRRK